MTSVKQADMIQGSAKGDGKQDRVESTFSTPALTRLTPRVSSGSSGKHCAPDSCVLFTKKFPGKSGWEVNGTRLCESSQRKISGSSGTSGKVVLYFSGRNVPNGNSSSVPSSHLWYWVSDFRGRFNFRDGTVLYKWYKRDSGTNLPRDGTGRDTMSFRPENYLQTCGEADLAKETKWRMGTQKRAKRTEGDKFLPCVNLQQCRCSIRFLNLQAPSSFSSRCFC